MTIRQSHQSSSTPDKDWADLALYFGKTDATSVNSILVPSQSRNEFVETALAFALSYIRAASSARIHATSITILADTDYYSNPGKPRPGSPFLDFAVPLTSAHKTGLGSSAALVTALIAAVASHYLPRDVISLDTHEGKARLHNLAQAAHCAAQGKVGSGFDVAAAVYGSCLYKRFSPSVLESLGESGSPGFAKRLSALVDGKEGSVKWDTVIDKGSANMPRGLKLLMCDVDCGSESVGMAKNVLKWRKEHPEEASLLWATLQRGTDDLSEELQRLTLVQNHGSYDNLSNVILTIRSLVREMSAKAGVPVEPQVQTDLLDACCRLPGVIGGVVPGAGGYDAVALIIKDRPSPSSPTPTQADGHTTREQLQDLLSGYKVEANGEDGASIGKVRLLDVQQESLGLKIESPSLYEGWVTLAI